MNQTRYAPKYRTPTLPENSVPLLLLGGDSLCVGALAELSGIPALWLPPGDPKTKFWKDNTVGGGSFVDMAIYSDNNYALQSGQYWFSGEQMAHQLSDYYGGVTVYIVKYGQGGAYARQGLGVISYRYDIFISECINAINTIEALGKTPIIPFAWWDIGTNDSSGDATTVNGFQDSLNWIYSSIKTDLSLPDLKFVWNRIPAAEIAPNRLIIRSKGEAFVAEDTAKRFLINTDSFNMADLVHRNTEGNMQVVAAGYSLTKNWFMS